MLTKPHSSPSFFFAFFIGISVPSLIMGRLALAIFFAFALLELVSRRPFKSLLQDAVGLSRSPLGVFVALTSFVWLFGAWNSSFPIRSAEAVLRTPLLLAFSVLIFSALQRNNELQVQCHKAFILACAVAVSVAVISIVGIPELYWSVRLKGWRHDEVHAELKGFSALSLFFIPILIIIFK